ncbi:MAG: pilus assembly protein [Endomicrobia bacterium]|nr:pilus assembly protein [Endomicrobiia bacterium]MCL2507350.1 pilus assembly protein [Endomicrobiia bacterium]
MLLLNKFKKSSGQALVEAALIAPLIIFFLFTVIWFARVMLTWQQITGAARYGTDLIVYTPYSEDFIKKDVRNYLCHGNNIGRTLDRDPKVLDIKVKANDAAATDYTLNIGNISKFNPLNIAKNIKDLVPFVGAVPSYVEITYEYKIPRILRITGNDHITIKARSEVLSGDASARYKKRRKR